MDAFSLRDRIVDEYRSFATSFTSIFAQDIRQQVDSIYAEGRFWPEPLIQIRMSVWHHHGHHGRNATGNAA
jgi:hypothetical protein